MDIYDDALLLDIKTNFSGKQMGAKLVLMWTWSRRTLMRPPLRSSPI
jgi:hypothetical protein